MSMLERRQRRAEMQCHTLRTCTEQARRQTARLRDEVQRRAASVGEKTSLLQTARDEIVDSASVSYATQLATMHTELLAAATTVSAKLQAVRQRRCRELLQIFQLREVMTKASSVPTVAQTAPWELGAQSFPTLLNLTHLERDDINGVLSYAAQLVRLLSLYLGLVLPFQISHVHGRLALTATPAWADDLPRTPQGLFLTHAVYRTLHTHFTNEVQSSSTTMSASAAASSGFVFVPPAAREERKKRVVMLHSIDGESVFSCLGGFAQAWMMLMYDIVYIAYTQGFKIRRLSAATNPLWLLSAALSSPHFACKSHASWCPPGHLDQLSLPLLPYQRFVALINQRHGH